MKRKESGDQGEAFAARYLESLGYEYWNVNGGGAVESWT